MPNPGHYLIATAACLATAALAKPLTTWVDPVNLVMLFLLTVFLVALRLGRGPALLAAFLSVALFDFFFIPPHLTFAVEDTQHLITFAVMLVVALATAHLTARLGQEAESARERERRGRALYEMARELGATLTPEQVAEVCQRFLRRAAGVEAYPRFANDQDQLATDDPMLRRAFVRGEAVEKRGPSGRGAICLYLPMLTPTRVRGVLELHADPDTLSREQPLLDAVASLAGIAAERLHYVEVAQRTELAMASEKLRNTVLASLSHDLRTPLTALVGLAETLDRADLPAPHGETARTLYDQSTALAGMVANLLDLARLAVGAGMSPRKDWQTIEDSVAGALRQLGPSLTRHPVRIDLPPDLPLLEFDALLIERVLANLIENAVKHAPDGAEIVVSAAREGDRVEVAVANPGPGFPSGLDLTMPFARGGLRPGTGLGLAIARAIVEAHGGTLRLVNPPEGGARALFDLPVGQAPGVEEDAP